jgi:hypothetical protein
MVSIGVPQYVWLTKELASRRWRLGLAVLACMVAVGTASAAPEVDIKAQSLLQLGEVKKIAFNRARISGNFVDRLTSTGIADARISITVGKTSVVAVTGSTGEFSVDIDVDAGELAVGLYFAGSDSIDPTSAETVTDPERSPTTLRMTATPTANGADVSFTTTEGPDRLPVVLTAIVATKTLPLGVTTTGDIFPLTRTAVGGPGAITLKATFAGDEQRQPATAELGLELRVGTVTTLQINGAVQSHDAAFEDSLTASGTVVDDDRRPVSSASLAIYAAEKRIDQATTDSQGRFAIDFEAKLLGQGQTGITARVERNAAMDGSTSQPVIVAVAAPQPVPVRHTMLAFVATAIAAIIFFALRRRRSPSAKVTPAESQQPAVNPQGGVTLAKPGFTSTLRRPWDVTLSGQVRDAWRMRTLPFATITLTLGTEQLATQSNAEGRFSFEELPPGAWQVQITAAGHIAESVTATIPHRGELRGIAIDLVPVRERVFYLYRRAAEPLLPKPQLWGVWSPRQIFDHVRTRRSTAALSALTDFVEEVYFSSRIADESILPLASQRVEDVMTERSGHR